MSPIVIHDIFAFPTTLATMAVAAFVADKYAELKEIRYELVYDDHDPDAAGLKFYDADGNHLWLPLNDEGEPLWVLSLESLGLAAWVQNNNDGYVIGTIEEGYESGIFEDFDEEAA